MATQTQGSSSQPFGYTGQQQDAESGFVFLRARYYDPAVGRFLTRDTESGTTSSPQTLNRYTYALDDPVAFVDPGGDSSWGIDAHKIIQADFIKRHPNFQREVVHLDPALAAIKSPKGSIRVDLEDPSTGTFYEIKPAYLAAEGRRQIQRYQRFPVAGGRSLTPGGWDKPMLLPTDNPLLWLAAWHDPTFSGLILYTYVPLIPGAIPDVGEDDTGDWIQQCLSKVLT